MRYFKEIFRALRHKNYRYFFTGQLVSLIGSWMQSIALSWLIFRLTNSSQKLGTVNFCNQLPVLLFAVWGGVVADHFNRRKILIITQFSCMVLAGLLATITLTDYIKVWHLYIFALALGITQAFDIPARQSIIVELVGKEDLSNAIILNSSMFNGARLVGPAIAGLVIDWIGEGWCFAANSLSYIAVLVGLLAMKIIPHSRKSTIETPTQGLKDGFNFIIHSFPTTALLLMLGAVSMLAAPQVVLMPAVTKQILHGQANTMGYLLAMSGIGAFVGALLLALRKKAQGMEKLIAFAMTTCGFCFIFFGNSTTRWISMLLMVPIGFCLMAQMASSNTLIQNLVPDYLRGRVMSFHAMMFMGGAPVGALLSGYLAERIGIPLTFTAAGACMILIGCAFTLNLRRYRILSERLLRQTERVNQQ